MKIVKQSDLELSISICLANLIFRILTKTDFFLLSDTIYNLFKYQAQVTEQFVNEM